MKTTFLMTAVLILVLGVLYPVFAEEVVRVGIVTPSSSDDASFSQSLFESLVVFQEEMGAVIQCTLAENLPSADDAEPVLQQYAADEYDLVFAHGSQYVGVVGRLAAEFPDVTFLADASASTYIDDGLTNILMYEVDTRAGAYVMGVLAGTLTSTGQAGFIGSVQISSTLKDESAFRLGVLTANPDAQVTSIWIDSFTDTTLAANAARTLIDQGVDVLTGISQAMSGAIREANDRSAYWFGAQADPSRLAPGSVVASFIYDWTGLLGEAVTVVSTRTPSDTGFTYTLTLGNGGIRFVANAEALMGGQCEIESLMWRTAADLLTGAVQPNWESEL